MRTASWKERWQQARQDAILDAARDLIAQRGYANVSMDDIAALVGISKPTLYQQYASKDDLTLAVIARSLEDAEATLRTLDPGVPAVDRLELAFRHHLARRSEFWTAQVTLLPSHVHEHPQYREGRARVQALVTDLVREAQREGDLRGDLPAPVVARLLGQTFTLPTDDLLGEDLSAGDLVEALVSAVFHGLRRAP